MSGQILVVDDDRVHLRLVENLLARAAYEVDTAMTADEALRRLEGRRYDLVILDLGLPDEDGINLCRQLRRRWFFMPVIMLTARSDAREKVLGLEVGADDYVTKPFEAEELLARVSAQLRRTRDYQAGIQQGDTIQLGALTLDFNARDAVIEGRPAKLTTREFEVLELLARHANKAIPRERVFEQVWGYTDQFNTNSLDVIIYRIRNKIEKDPQRPHFLITVRGFGYKLVGDQGATVGDSA